MASGQIFALFPVSPGSSPAILDYLVGASTPPENAHIASFPDTAAAYMDFQGTLQGYGGSGLKLRTKWSALSATGSCVWQSGIRRIADDAENFTTTAHTYDFNAVVAAAPTVIGQISYDDIVFTDGVDMDSLADGEAFFLRMLRDPLHGSDNLGNTAQLWWPSLVLVES